MSLPTRTEGELNQMRVVDIKSELDKGGIPYHNLRLKADLIRRYMQFMEQPAEFSGRPTTRAPRSPRRGSSPYRSGTGSPRRSARWY